VFYFDLKKSGLLNYNNHNKIISSDTTIVNIPSQTIDFKPVIIERIIEKPIPSKIDTSKILQDYYREKHLNDVIENDTIKIRLREVISKNSMLSRELSWTLKIPNKIITNTVVQEEIKRKILFGGQLNYDYEKITVNPGIGFKDRKNNFYLGSYNIYNKEIGFGIYVPIKR